MSLIYKKGDPCPFKHHCDLPWNVLCNSCDENCILEADVYSIKRNISPPDPKTTPPSHRSGWDTIFDLWLLGITQPSPKSGWDILFDLWVLGITTPLKAITILFGGKI
jgi:hypothetical protein